MDDAWRCGRVTGESPGTSPKSLACPVLVERLFPDENKPVLKASAFRAPSRALDVAMVVIELHALLCHQTILLRVT